MPPPTATQNGAPTAPPTVNPRESIKSTVSPKHIPSYPNGDSDAPPLPLQTHQRLAFTDPVALRYLEEDPSTNVLHRRMTLQGYEVYVVEQWACSRIHPTFVITTYTGDPSHTVVVGILGVPTDESTWSPRLKLYFSAVTKCHARRIETPLGALMVTDLSTFPSVLTVIPVPDGDFKKHRDDFIVNEDLKRLGCAGRAGLRLQQPPPATEAKFHQLYRTSERVALYSAVMELVKQCQMALMMFDKLAPEYVDGLLCDVTETAINDWWTDIGIDLYNIEPNDGVMGPTTVAALLGTLLGARNRLHALGAPVAKDAFDIHNLKRGVGRFQKSQKMKKTRRLDRQTLDKLHRVTAKAANAEGWTDAVKSTMAELSGQGGEMVMGMVRGRDKAGIADIETLDIDNFPHLVTGERAKWLWRGKPRKSGVGDGFSSGPPASDMIFTTDDHGRYIWTTRRRHSNEDLATDRSFPAPEHSLKAPEQIGVPDERDQNLSKMVFKGVSDKVSDARIGFGRFKDAVGLPGLRSHHHRLTKEGTDFVGDAAYLPPIDSETEASEVQKTAIDGIQPGNEPVQDTARYEEEQAGPPLPRQPSELKPPDITVEPVASTEGLDSPVKPPDDDGQTLMPFRTRSSDASDDRGQQIPRQALMTLRRPQSCTDLRSEDDFGHKDNYFPRHLSFSTVEEVILGWESVGGKPSVKDKPNATFEEAISLEDTRASDARIFCSRVLDLDQNTVPWVERQVDSVDEMNRILYDRHEDINAAYLEHHGYFQQIRDKSSDVLTDEHMYLADYMKRVELQGAKLDYELNVLGSKVEEVESGIEEFERHIFEMETRVKTLIQGEEEKQSNSWLSWFGRLTGFATQ